MTAPEKARYDALQQQLWGLLHALIVAEVPPGVGRDPEGILEVLDSYCVRMSHLLAGLFITLKICPGEFETALPCLEGLDKLLLQRVQRAMREQDASRN